MVRSATAIPALTSSAKRYIYRMLDRASVERGGKAVGDHTTRVPGDTSPFLNRAATSLGASSPVSPAAAVALTARRSSTVPIL